MEMPAIWPLERGCGPSTAASCVGVAVAAVVVVCEECDAVRAEVASVLVAVAVFLGVSVINVVSV